MIKQQAAAKVQLKLQLCQKEKDLTSICNEMKLNEYEVLSLVSALRNEGINMTTKVKDDGIYLLDQGESL